MHTIPVHRPKLPTGELILPFLKKIDEKRWYSNFGDLLNLFEKRMAAHFEVEPSMVATAANGTIMLIAILKALNLVPGTLCIMPSWTFVATPAAANYAGLVPYFVDVDTEKQYLDVQTVKQALAEIKTPVGAVITVAPFGAPIDRASWDNFTEETGIPVIIDAAAAFDTINKNKLMTIGATPTMVSLHATKVLGMGEGGLVLSTNQALIKAIKSSTNFGFNANRVANTLGVNAKLSEYSAAVGLAALDQWQQTRVCWEKVRDCYIDELTKMGIKHYLSSSWVSTIVNINIPESADVIAKSLIEEGIETRKWWNGGCHLEPAYEKCPRSVSLKNTEWLGRSILGLPTAVDLEPKTITYICQRLKKILNPIGKIAAC